MCGVTVNSTPTCWSWKPLSVRTPVSLAKSKSGMGTIWPEMMCAGLLSSVRMLGRETMVVLVSVSKKSSMSWALFSARMPPRRSTFEPVVLTMLRVLASGNPVSLVSVHVAARAYDASIVMSAMFMF